MKKQALFIALVAAIAVLLATAAAALAAETAKAVKVFILAGQSNMEGKAADSLLDYQAEAPGTRDLFKHLRKDGKWIVRDDVFIKFLDRKGPLTVGYGSPGCTGVELEFGTQMGDHFHEPVLLIKAAWGGHSLYQSFRSPSAGYPMARLQAELENRQKQVKQDNEKNQRNDPLPTMDDIKKTYGPSYRAMLAEMKETFDKYETMFPELKDQRLEVAGFVWFQGWNDMNAGGMDEEYASNMKHFIKDVRKDLGVPNLPFVIAAMGQNGSKPADGELLTIREAQMAMNGVPEFKGNVKAFRTDLLVDQEAERLIDGWEQHAEEWKKVGSNWGYHYLGSAIWFNRIGEAMGEAMLELMNSDAVDSAAGRWRSEPPADCPFKPSETIAGLEFTGRHAEYTDADTWYPSWASDGNMYSPWTDGTVNGLGCGSGGDTAATGYATIMGDDPLKLTVTDQGVFRSSPRPYESRYPCGSLVYNGVWYYGTYCLHPSWRVETNGIPYNWPWLGPIPGFRWSTDFGKTWTETPGTPAKPLFGESALKGEPLKIGAPHFVDFGKNMEHSPDGKAYLTGHGASAGPDGRRFAYNSWITGDEIYLVCVTPSIENMNDVSKYEFFAGHGPSGQPLWSHDFKAIKPLAGWKDNMGCVTMTFNAPLKKYFMCVTDGGNTVAYFNTYLLESDKITGPWKLVAYLKHFGEQAYFVNIPSKFISKDGRTMWLCYSANFAAGWGKEKIEACPAGSKYAMCLQEIRLLATAAQTADDVLFDDFESGHFDKWTVEGDAFGKGPLEIEGLDSPKPKALAGANWARIYSPGRQGKYVAHSAGQNANDQQGNLTSQPFAIERRFLKFLIGGGSSPATRMDLLVDGKVVRTASGEDLFGVTERVWDVAEFKGRQAVLQIVDSSSGAWGYIAVDRIVMSDALTSAPWVEDPRDFITLRIVQPGNPWNDGWVKDPNAKLLLMGDSITAGWDGNAFNKFCVNRSYVNLGRSMEQAAHLLWRLDNINCEGAQAKLIVLMIGSNDGACNFSSQDVAAGVGAVVAKLQAKMPQAKVLVMSILPRGDLPRDKQQVYTKTNPMIAKLADGKSVFYLDICEKYFRPDGTVDPALLGDLCHPTGKGYEIWAEAMEPLFKKLLDER